MNTVFDLSYVLNRSWEVFKNHWVKLSLMSLCLIGLVYAVSIFLSVPPPSNPTAEEMLAWYADNAFSMLLSYTIPGLLQYVILVFIYKEILSIIKGVPIQVTADIVLRFIVVSVIATVLSYVALFCCIIPFFFVMPRLILAPLYVIDNPQMSIGQAIEASWAVTKGNVLNLILLGIVVCGIGILGVFCCFVGVIPASAFTYVILVVAYLILTKQMGFKVGAETYVQE